MPRPSRIVRRVVLERVSRPLLAQLLSAHSAFFAAHAFPLAALAASAQSDRTFIQPLFALLHAHAPALSPPLPDALRAALLSLDALATSRGAEELIRLDTSARLPRGTLGDEDRALTALLFHPALAADARVAAESDLPQSFTEYDAAESRPLSFTDAERTALEQLLAHLLESRDRARYCLIHVTGDSSLVRLEIVHTRRPKTVEKVDAPTLAVSQSTDMVTDRAFIEIDLRARRLAIHAAMGVKELARRAVSEVLAGDPAYFRAARVYDLAPLTNLASVLSVEGVPGLERVEVRDLALRTPKGTTVSFARPWHDLLGDEGALAVLRAAFEQAAPVGVKLYLSLAGRARPVRLELSAKDGNNRIDYDRDDSDVVDAVRAYLRARGILRDLEPSVRGQSNEASESRDAGQGSLWATA